MKLSLSVLSLFFYSFVQAAPSSCETTAITLTLNANSSHACSLANIEGSYQIKLCSNDQGLLADQDKFVRYLFKDGDAWMARQDLIDYTRGITNTEILSIKNQVSEFKISKIKSKSTGKVLSKLDCAGTIQAIDKRINVNVF